LLRLFVVSLLLLVPHLQADEAQLWNQKGPELILIQ